MNREIRQVGAVLQRVAGRDAKIASPGGRGTTPRRWTGDVGKPPRRAACPGRRGHFWHRGSYRPRIRGPAFRYPPDWGYHRWTSSVIAPLTFHPNRWAILKQLWSRKAMCQRVLAATVDRLLKSRALRRCPTSVMSFDVQCKNHRDCVIPRASSRGVDCFVRALREFLRARFVFQ